MLDDEELQRIYQWVDEIPLSRPKRSIARDFADGVLIAEVVHHYFPKLIELHNYSGANGYAQKIYNWSTLNQKVFKKIGFQLQKEEMDNLCNCHPQAVERLLKTLQMKMAKYGAKRAAAADAGEHVSPSGSAPTSSIPKATPRSTAARAAAPSRIAGAALAAAGTQQDGQMLELLSEKDLTIRELRETVDILEIKIQACHPADMGQRASRVPEWGAFVAARASQKLEQLVRLKDSKIATLQAKLQHRSEALP